MSVAPREVTPFGFGSQHVGTQLVRVAQEGGKQIPVLLARWEMLIAYFKHGLEIPLCLDSKNEELIEQHRMILTSAMGMGDLLSTKTKALKDAELRALGYSRNFITANLRYLRDTYEQWYVAKDKETLENDFRAISNALPEAH